VILALLRRGALLAVGLLAWEACARSGAFHPILFPTLASIGRELAALLVRPDAIGEAWQSLARALSGFGLAAALGVLVGVAMGRSATVAGLLDPLFSTTYPIPKIALFPIFIFALGIGSLSKIALIFLECLYPVVINTYAGTRAVNRVLLWSAANMGASPGQTLRKIVVPAAAPYIFAGFRVALPIAMIVVTITEMIGSADGLGYLAMYSLSSLRTDRMLAVVVIIALLGLGLDRLLVLVRNRLVFWEKLESYYA
jgi:NitT/TauT family transport system permease protein